MSARSLLERLDVAAAAVRALLPRGTVARESRRIWRAEIASSTALAGSSLGPDEVDALLDTGVARGGHRLTDYVLVRAYADGARWVADQRTLAPGDPRPLLTVDEFRHLNLRARSDRGGMWRLTNLPQHERIVSPAAWLVPREVDGALDRYRRGPGALPIPLWIARFLSRINRIRAFEDANGRTSRLAANVLLRRLDFPPIVFERRERARYEGALAAAEGNDHGPLAELITRSLVRTCDRLLAASGQTGAELQPLHTLAGDAYMSLAKAAQRGRLRTIMRGGRYYTTAAWIAEYRSTR